MSQLVDVLKYRGLCMSQTANQEYLKKYLMLIESMDSGFADIKYSLLLETNVIEILSPELIYPNYYIQKKRLLERLSLYYYGECKNEIDFVKKEKRIAICTNTWRDKGYSIGVVIVALANEFYKQGYDVTVFVENQFEHDSRIKNIIHADLLVDAREYAIEHSRMLVPGIRVLYGNGKTMAEKVTDQINHIFQYDPLFVLDLTDENSCCSRILYQKFPVLYFPMRSNHGTSMFFHKYLAVDPKRMKQINALYRSFDSALIEPIVGGITEFPIAGKFYKREEEFGRVDAFILVTVGNRLIYDCSKEFVDFAVQLLLEYPDFMWVFAGGDVPDYLLEERKRLCLDRRIMIRGYEEDLVALYHICDVYVNPMRKGGGLSVAWAMNEGLPVAMIKFMSDGLCWLGEENAVEGGYKELGQYIVCLWNDANLYKRVQEKMKLKASQRTPQKCVGQLMQIYQKMKEKESYSYD